MENRTETINKLINNEIDTVILDDEHELVKTSLAVNKDELEGYIKRLRYLKDMGVNIVSVVDYILINNNKKNNTEGFYVIDRTYGTKYDYDTEVKISRKSNIREGLYEYLQQNKAYLNELEKRANAPIDHYSKLVKDLINMYLVGMKHNGVLYDEEKGFIIKDIVYPIEANSYNSIGIEVIDAIYGMGRPIMHYNYRFIEYLPKEYVDRYNEVYEKIIQKLMMALRSNEVHYDYIGKALDLCSKRIEYTGDIAKSRDQIINKLKYDYSNRIKFR